MDFGYFLPVKSLQPCCPDIITMIHLEALPNMRFLLKTMLGSPIRIVTFSWLLVAIAYVIFPFSFNEAWVPKTCIFVFFAWFALAFGYLLGKELACPPKKQKDPILDGLDSVYHAWNSRIELNRLVTILAIIGIIGSIAFAADLVIVRGIDYSRGLSWARTELQINTIQQGGIPRARLLSVLARIAHGFAPVAALIALLRLEQVRINTLRLCIFTLILSIFAGSLTGGRNAFFIALILLLAGMLQKYLKLKECNLSRTKKAIIQTAAGFLVFSFFIYALAVFVDRETALRGRALTESYQNLEETFLITFDFEFSSCRENFFSHLFLAITKLIVYLTHSLNEINLIIRQGSNVDMLFGRHSLGFASLLFGKLFYSIGLLENPLKVSDVFSPFERSGRYISMLGSLYADFGYWLSHVVLFYVGLASGFLWRQYKRTDALSTELFCSFVIMTLIVSPFYLSLNTANGFQIFIALTLSAYSASKLKL